MKRLKKVSTSDDIEDYDNPIARVNVESVDYFIGKIFTHTELLGLNERQLSAYKSTLRKMFWDWFNNHLPNPNGLSDPSHQARVKAGIEPNYTVNTTPTITYTT